MKKQTSKPFSITDWEKDELLLQYPKTLDGWGICPLDDDTVFNAT